MNQEFLIRVPAKARSKRAALLRELAAALPLVGVRVAAGVYRVTLESVSEKDLESEAPKTPTLKIPPKFRRGQRAVVHGPTAGVDGWFLDEDGDLNHADSPNFWDAAMDHLDGATVTLDRIQTLSRANRKNHPAWRTTVAWKCREYEDWVLNESWLTPAPGGAA